MSVAGEAGHAQPLTLHPSYGLRPDVMPAQQQTYRPPSAAPLPDGQNTCANALICPPCPVPPVKIFCFSEMQITSIFTPSRPTEGRVAIVTAAGRDAVDADAPITNGADRGRRRRVVLTPRRWCQVLEKRRLLRGDGGQRARAPGRARYNP